MDAIGYNVLFTIYIVNFSKHIEAKTSIAVHMVLHHMRKLLDDNIFCHVSCHKCHNGWLDNNGKIIFQFGSIQIYLHIFK